jgi:hypothetical protein
LHLTAVICSATNHNMLCRGEGAELVSSAQREAGGVVRYDFQFSKPLDPSLPRSRSNRCVPDSLPSVLYIYIKDLCVTACSV